MELYMPLKNKIEIKCAVCKDTLYVENPADYRFHSNSYICYRCKSKISNTKEPRSLLKNYNENGDYIGPQE